MKYRNEEFHIVIIISLFIWPFVFSRERSVIYSAADVGEKNKKRITSVMSFRSIVFEKTGLSLIILKFISGFQHKYMW